MDKSGKIYKTYVQTLKEELIPAMGCTEPIAIAYAAAKAREVLGCEPDLVKIGVSNNIIKNVKSVVVPNTDGMKGIEAAAVAGILGGNAAKELEVISEVTANQKAAMRRFLSNVPISVEAIDNGIIFDIIIALYCGTDSAVVRISQYHTNIVYIKKNDEVLLDNTARQTSAACNTEAESGLTDRSLLTIANIYDFAETCDRRNNSMLNYGVAICKYTGSRGKGGASDASAEAMGHVRSTLDKAGVIWQIATLGKVDQGGGGTVAAYMANRNIVTVGVPVLSMHAPLELVSKLDCYETMLACKAIYLA